MMMRMGVRGVPEFQKDLSKTNRIQYSNNVERKTSQNIPFAIF